MKPVLIEDSRLHQDLERYRSGPRQSFRENGAREEGFSITPPKKSWYAELIGKKWYWVEGCMECRGEVRDKWKSYVECAEHDKCEVCAIKRGEIKESPWGWKKGWVCAPCYAKEKVLEKHKAIEKFNKNPLDTEGTYEIICPYCGTEAPQDTEDFDHNHKSKIECDTCDGMFIAEIDYSVTYTTRKGLSDARS